MQETAIKRLVEEAVRRERRKAWLLIFAIVAIFSSMHIPLRTTDCQNANPQIKTHPARRMLQDNLVQEYENASEITASSTVEQQTQPPPLLAALQSQLAELAAAPQPEEQQPLATYSTSPQLEPAVEPSFVEIQEQQQQPQCSCPPGPPGPPGPQARSSFQTFST